MTFDQVLVLAIVGLTIAGFTLGRWRHDMVAVAALLACVVTGLVAGTEAFAGFGHPAVITVACVLILSHGLQRTGAVDAIARRLLPRVAGPTSTIASLTGLATLLSAFMNNVGALALLLPVALQRARRLQMPPGRLLMPLAFGSILGGMTTLIGTPPNLIVSAFRADQGGVPFAMFDFTPVGLAVALAGGLFIVLVGWRLVPARETQDLARFDTGTYFTEARVVAESRADGATIASLDDVLSEADAQIVGIVRAGVRLPAPYVRRALRADDILVLEAEPKALPGLLSALGLRLEEDVRNNGNSAEADEGAEETKQKENARKKAKDEEKARKKESEKEKGEDNADEEPDDSTAGDTDEFSLAELAVQPNSDLIERSARDLLLRTRFAISLLAIARQGRTSIRRLRATRIKAGDVLLVQGTREAIAAFTAAFSCVPLAARALHIHDPRRAMLAGLIMIAAIAGTAIGLLPAAVAFAGAVLAFMALRIVPPRSAYDAIDGSVVVLLAALIPVAGAMEETGAADALARLMIDAIGNGAPWLSLTVILVMTMFLSDVMNNAATAAVMCPIAISVASQLGAGSDTFLMAVAVGASCAFLTPIGHQNNTLILGPGGFRFGDYWRLGVPLEAIVVAVAVPLILWVW